MRRVHALPRLVGVVLVACGARTPLNADVCPTDGEVRVCSNACGDGVQMCIAGLWSACDVPTAERSCRNTCGDGLQQCSAGEWQRCVVAPTTRACTNDCGEGIQTCVDDTWGKCEVSDTERACASVCGSGVERCRDGEWQPCDAPQPKPPVLKATIRDFLDSHPDFEEENVGVDPGIVSPRLGDDGKPVYAHPDGRTETTSGQAAFDQWYRDVPGVNQRTELTLPLTPTAGTDGVFVYDDSEFFPIDGQLLGNQGRVHNYHFTLELHTEFMYRGGEVFTFDGDDDLWVFVNGWLAIDLGGTHRRLSGTVVLDEHGEEFGIAPGNVYGFDLFFAERHVIHSNFHIETTISEFANCD